GGGEAPDAALGTARPALADRVIRVSVRRKAFGASEVLRDVAFEVAPGECVAILGPSGVGKSTLLRIVAGLDAGFEGEVERPERIAVVFQEPVLLPWRTAVQNLTLTTGIGAEAAEAALARVGLQGKGGLFPGQLSLGQQRRLALARALAARPELLILDEPFASLDAERAAEMLELTARLIRAERPATLFVTHLPHEAKRLADRVLRLEGQPARLVAGR
ncbi:MAG TPA: ATP-binding cassette domain-containing protein, partial [Paracoccaceae bacterium]|nr:ATP-binding cassette domain-containing protein [Paracoccaceae bacterium]